MKIAAFRDMTRGELTQKKRDLVEERFNLVMRRTLKPLDNPLLLRTIRRDLARIATLLHEDESGIRKISEGAVDVLGEKKKEPKKPAAAIETSK